MIEFGKAANESGYVWSLHENYIDLYPDAPSYAPAARVLLADGTPSKAWYNPGTKVQSFGLKCNRALGFARQNAPEIHRRFGTTAAYLDVHTCVAPWHQLDHEANQPMAAMALAKVRYDTELFQFMRFLKELKANIFLISEVPHDGEEARPQRSESAQLQASPAGP